MRVMKWTLFTYFCNAFDSVPHGRLIRNLKKLGFTDVYLNWIFQFLMKRKMKVKVNDKVSMWANILGGEPQGSVLEPLMLLLYVNELPDCVVNSM